MTELEVLRKGLDEIVDEFISGPDPTSSPVKSKLNKGGSFTASTWTVREICKLLIDNGIYLDLIRSNPRLLNSLDSRLYKVGLLILRNCGVQLPAFIDLVVRAQYEGSVSQKEKEKPKRPVNVPGLIQSALKGEDPCSVKLQVCSDELYIRVRRERFVQYCWKHAREVELGHRPNALEYAKLRDYRWGVHGLDEVFESYSTGFGIRGKSLLSRQGA